jgi:aminopeptidase N
MKSVLSLAIFLSAVISNAQFTRKDSLHGGMRPERSCYDLLHYDLNIKIDPEKRTVSGHNDISFKMVQASPRLQIDLFDNMKVDRIELGGKSLKFVREHNAIFVSLPKLEVDQRQTMRVHYSGTPKTARRAPWDGGFDWKKDKNGQHWIGIAVQGTGASLWYPCKESQADEPEEGAIVRVAVPDGLMNVSNGRFLGSTKGKGGYTRWDWEVKSPINNYNITVNIADYVHIHENHNGLDLDYYVLRYNEETARRHFEEVKPMMDCFQAKFGIYPFTKDGYKLVETPYLGMEHQSAVAYGNKYLKGYLGNDMSMTGIGRRFDYIIIHETGHEWFGNSITSTDIADMWIHEGFTTYSEAVFVECQYGYEDAMKYLNGIKKNISNDKPIIGNYGVNSEGSGDMYPKGAWIVNMIRSQVDDDSKWWPMLLKYSTTFERKIIDTKTVEDFFSKELGKDLSPFFDQYLRTTKVPELVLSRTGDKLSYSWRNVVPGFDMPVDINLNGKKTRIFPIESPQDLPFTDLDTIKVRDDLYLMRVKYP